MLDNLPITQTKVCKRCEQEKPVTEFYARAGLKDRLHIYCKACCRKMIRTWEQENPERKRELRVESNARNADKISEYGRQYRLDNPEAVRAAVDRWNSENYERKRNRRHEYNKENATSIREKGKRWRDENPEKMRAAINKWRREHPAEDREMHERSNYKRRAQMAAVLFDATVNIIDLFVRDAGVCQICMEDCEIHEMSIDHIRPISKGGAHTWSNVQLAHLICNCKKGAR